MNFKAGKCFICAFCTLTLAKLILTAPTSEEPALTTEQPDLTSITESQTSSDITLDKLKLLQSEILAASARYSAEAHFEDILQSHGLTNLIDGIESAVLEKTRPSLPSDIISQAKSCTNIKSILKSITTITNEYIKLSEGIANSRYRQSYSTTLTSLRSLTAKISEMLNDQQSSQYTSSEVRELAGDFMEVLATVAHIKQEMITCITVFKSLRLCEQ